MKGRLLKGHPTKVKFSNVFTLLLDSRDSRPVVCPTYKLIHTPTETMPNEVCGEDNPGIKYITYFC